MIYIMQKYHDEEWGKRVKHTALKLSARLSLDMTSQDRYFDLANSHFVGVKAVAFT